MTFDKGKITVAEALARLPGSKGERFTAVLERGSLTVEIYAARGSDPQKPHTRDEVYVVVLGNGEFINGPGRESFGPVIFSSSPPVSNIAL